MVMDTFVEMFPKTVKRINNAFIFLLDVGILGIISWQLLPMRLRVQKMRQVSKILEIPVCRRFLIWALLACFCLRWCSR